MGKSLLEGIYSISSEKEMVNFVKNLCADCIQKSLNLYEAQDFIKDEIIKKKDEKWFEDYGEGVNFIIENEYINNENLVLEA